ncbi:hypothetical protein [Nocardioides gilvus]|uniref:hypothetical protein n=1 Tax=Nocardioides gilvus TaxID=1735589 RepID=UPI0013A54950|nr:hypothetical protein [Nocardioides gilvus]
MNPDIVQIAGWFRPHPDRILRPDEVATTLRAAGLSGAVGAPSSTGDLPLVVAAQERRPLVVPGTAQLLVDALAEVAEATRGAIMLTDEQTLVTPPSMEDDWQAVLDSDERPDPANTNPPDVLLARLDPDLLPMLARDVGCPFIWERAEGYVVVAFEEPSATLHEHGFTKPELPVVALSLIGGRRHLSVLLARGVLPGTTLSRQEHWALTQAPETVEEPAMRAMLDEFAVRHVTPEAVIEALLESPHLPHAEEMLLREALVAPDDEHWSARVLTALGLPTHAADIHEGRAILAAPARVEPQGLKEVLRSALGERGSADEEEWSRRGLGGRLQLALLRFPVLTVVVILLELALAGFMTNWLLGTDERPWWYWLGWVTVLALVVDAVADTVLLLRRRRSPEPAGPGGPGR